MASYGDKEICRVLKVVQESKDHSILWKSQDFTVCNEPEDPPEVRYIAFGHEEELLVQAAIEKGFLKHTNKAAHEYPYEVNHTLRLTAMGNDFLNEIGAPILQRWWRNIVSNLPTFIGAVFTALVIAWLSKFI